MKSNYFKNIAGAVVMAFALILGISSMTTAQAQYPYPDDRYRQQDDRYRQRDDRYRRDRWNRNRYRDTYPDWGGWEFRQTALNAGYNEGLKAGRNDRNRQRGWGYGNDFRNYGSYQNATKDYNSRFGNRELYRRYFQMAFETGYRDGLNGN